MLLEELESLNEIMFGPLSLVKKEILDWRENERIEPGEGYDKADIISCIKWLKKNVNKSGKSELVERVQYFIDYWRSLY